MPPLCGPEPVKRTHCRLLARVLLKNYKSIAACDISPAQLSFLVGGNGSGKSNFLDALSFVADALHFSVGHALLDRGGINEVRRRSGGHPTHFGIRVEFDLEKSRGYYAFTVGAKPHGGYTIQREECYSVQRHSGKAHFFRVEHGTVRNSTLRTTPVATPTRLYLASVSFIDAFRSAYEALSGADFYNLNPEAMRNLHPPDSGELLKPDGSNVASVLSNLGKCSPDCKNRIEEYLSKVVPGVVGVDRRRVGARETVEFRQQIDGSQHTRRFWASSMSDGALRALGLLVSLFQGACNGSSNGRFVGIEEPQAGLHPAAAGVLFDALRDAGQHSQILTTCNSPELLDNYEVSADSIFVVWAERGESYIGPLGLVARSILRDRLYTAGELLRMDQLDPESDSSNVKPGQIRLFGPHP